MYRVQVKDEVAALKLLTPVGKKDEGSSAVVLRCYAGRGCVRLIEADDQALLLSYADGRPLSDLVSDGRDDEATEVICQLIQKLHSYRDEIPAGLKSTRDSFQALFRWCSLNPDNVMLRTGSELAVKLLASETKQVLLHGDIHHMNTLWSSRDGWVAIDPKGLVGDPCYDLANVFYNPNFLPQLIERQDRIEMLSEKFSTFFNLERQRILAFAFSFGCLSAVWAMEDGTDPEPRLRTAALIQGLLGAA
ncbi:MAG: phosphotransferase [Oligoflexia bacterium]|nr:phosphotransferase [Oligoflexia bacterium]